VSSIIIKNGTIINEGKSSRGDILIIDDLIAAIGNIDYATVPDDVVTINASEMFVMPGIIDCHVHFREPGLTHKADIFTESRAAAAGGITSFMDMPNTVPPATTTATLNDKFNIAAEKSLINYSFYLGGTNSNIDQIMAADPETICGLKLFPGASSGNIFIDDEKTLREIFSKTRLLICCHCEDENIIKSNIDIYKGIYDDDMPPSLHPFIRSRDACFKSSSSIIKLAREFNTRLHILHLSTADEVKLFSCTEPVTEKKITAEACVHHLWFDDEDYERLGNLIKWNPAVKTKFDRKALINGINNNYIDIISTDHAPHALNEKKQPYLKAPSGGPLVQHSLAAVMELYHNKLISLEKIVEKMCHNPALIYKIQKRGFIREGFKADICVVNPDNPWKVEKENLLYKCRWSPFEGILFRSRVEYTIVNGNVVYNKGVINENCRGEKLLFKPK